MNRNYWGGIKLCIVLMLLANISTGEQLQQMFTVSNITYTLNASIDTNSYTLRINKYAKDITKNNITEKILVDLKINKVNTRLANFGYCPKSKFIWVLFERARLNSHSLMLYPLVYNNASERYIYQTKKINSSNKIINSFNVTQLIRQMVISKFKHDNTFSLEKNAKLSNVKMKCLENNIIEISCDIGKKYIFIGEIGVDMKSKNFFSRQLRIISKEK